MLIKGICENGHQQALACDQREIAGMGTQEDQYLDGQFPGSQEIEQERPDQRNTQRHGCLRLNNQLYPAAAKFTQHKHQGYCPLPQDAVTTIHKTLKEHRQIDCEFDLGILGLSDGSLKERLDHSANGNE
jgi:hypothetical protein